MTAGLGAFDWVTPSLAVGGCFPMAAAVGLAREHGLQLVVDLREEACDDSATLQEAGLRLLHLPTADNGPIADRHLELGVDAVADALRDGARVLIHCQHGIGRSALLALCVLSQLGDPPMDALRRLKGARRQVSPSPAQYECWAAWLRRRSLEPPQFGAFAEVAYAHLVKG